MGWGQGNLLGFAAKGLAGPSRTLGPQGESQAAGGASVPASDTSQPTYPLSEAGRASGPKLKPAMGAQGQPQAGRQAPSIKAAQRAVEPPPTLIEIPSEGFLVGTMLQMVGQPKFHLIGHFKSVVGSFGIQALPRPKYTRGADFDILLNAAHGGYIHAGFGAVYHVPMRDGRKLRSLILCIDDPAFPARLWLMAKPLSGWAVMGLYLVREAPDTGTQTLAHPEQGVLPFVTDARPCSARPSANSAPKFDTSPNPKGGSCNTPLQKYTGVE